MMVNNLVPIKIETERLILRNLKLADLSQDYPDWLNEPEFNKYLACAGKYHTLQSCQDYVRSYQGKSNTALIGIFTKDNSLHIGNITFSKIDWDNKSVTIGISIGRKSYTGKGFAKEALTAIIKHCFGSLRALRLYATISARNIKSLNLFMHCGFKIEKILYSNTTKQNGYLVSIDRKQIGSQIYL